MDIERHELTGRFLVEKLQGPFPVQSLSRNLPISKLLEIGAIASGGRRSHARVIPL